MNAEVKPGYKQTELGDIPDDWIVQEVQALASVRGGKRLPLGRSLVSDVTGHPYIRVTDMVPGGVDTRNIQYVPEDIFPQIKNYRIYIDDIFISVAGTLGIVGKIPHELDGANLTENADRITAITCNRDFLLYNLMSPRIQGVIESEKTVGAQPKLALGRIESFQIAIPPNSEEQKAIASALSDMDALISSLDQLIAKKRDIQQATMQQLLTGQRRLPGFSGEWEVKRLGDFGQCLRGVSYKGDADLLAYDTDETYRLLRSNNVQQSAIDVDGLQFVNARCVSSHQVLKPKDILICMANGSKDLVGKAGLFKVSDGHRYTFGAFMGCFRMRACAEPDFIFALFGTNKYKNYIANLLAGSSINNLRPRDIEQMEFHFPPNNEQTAIAAILSDMDSELAVLEARRDKAHHIKQGMMQELLTGRTRLI